MSERFDPSGPASGDGIFGLPHTPEEARVVLIPVPWEATTSYRKGTAGGPGAISEASRQVDLFDRETGRAYEQGIALLAVDSDIEQWNRVACTLAQPIIDRGGSSGDPALERALVEVNDLSKRLSDRVEKIADDWLSRGKLVGVVGGDHSTPLGLIRAVARKHPGVGVLHVDAHADLRDAYEGFTESHASIMFNVHAIMDVSKIVQIGVRDFSEDEARLSTESSRIKTFFDADLARRSFDGEPFSKVLRDIVSELPTEVYVSFDIDGLDPSLCPNTGTPVPGGLGFREACALFAEVRASGRRIVGFDLNEVAAVEWDANVGARILYKLIGFALKS